MDASSVRTIRTPLTDLLGCRYPIIQSPMTQISDVGLAVAASEAGAFGVFVSSIAPVGRVKEYLDRIGQRTSQPYGVYLSGFQPNLSEVLDAVCASRSRAAIYGRGFDRPSIARLKQAGLMCMATVGAVKHAAKAVDLGADVIVAQGGEGGGHTGPLATSVLLPQVLDAVRVPVVASGGFFDGRGLAAALTYGASGVAMGTRFLMTSDAPLSEKARQLYQATTDISGVVVSSAIDGLPQRVIANRLVKDLEGKSGLRRMIDAAAALLRWKAEQGVSNRRFAETAVRILRGDPGSAVTTVQAAMLPELLRRGLLEGDVEGGLFPSGQAVCAIAKTPSCADLIKQIVAEARIGLDRAATLAQAC